MINIIVDTREQAPWDFTFFGFTNISQKLKAGDYSIQGLEHKVLIERKATSGELAINLGKKSKQFKKELEIMSKVEHKYILCEFPMNDMLIFPVNSGIPTKLWPKLRMTSNYLTYIINELASTYGIKIIYSNSKTEANEKAADILRSVYEEQRRNSKAPW